MGFRRIEIGSLLEVVYSVYGPVSRCQCEDTGYNYYSCLGENRREQERTGENTPNRTHQQTSLVLHKPSCHGVRTPSVIDRVSQADVIMTF